MHSEGMDVTDLLVLVPILLLGLLLGLGGGLVAGSSRGAARLRDAETQSAAQLREAEARAVSAAATLDAEREAATHQLSEQRTAAEQRIADLRGEQERLAERFRALSAEALDRNTQEFLAMADRRLTQERAVATGDLDQRRQAIEHLVEPLTASLAKVEAQLGYVEKARAQAYGELRQQVETMGRSSEQLRVETAQLVAALRAPQVRGRWGEMQLRRVVEAAGMVEHCDFTEQPGVRTAEGTLRPDVVVRLAGGKQVVVDAKVSFLGFLEAMEARDEATRVARLRAHARHLRDHIDDLGAKAYWEHFAPTPEFVVMFVPAEAFLAAALDEDPTLLERGFERNVIVATPTTLIAMLRTVAYTWRQDALARNAQDVVDLGKQLHSRLATMGGHFNRLGTQLNVAVKKYNETVASLEGRVLVTARRFAELKVIEGEGLDSPAQIEVVAREVQAAELLASASDALVALPDVDREPTELRASAR